MTPPTAEPTTGSKKGALALKISIFATGFSGIVAEYAMSTLASYLLGNSVVQWTLTISLMLFAMGLGSRISKQIETSILEAFILAELALSLLTAASAVLVYFLASFVQYIGPIIYGISIAIGLLIGLEMPLATRINERFESLRINISNILEKDYYGALAGGLIFAFVALPFLGLTYTPIVLGAINFIAATVVYLQFRDQMPKPKRFLWGFALVPVLLVLVAFLAQPVVLFGEQKQYRDKVIHSEQSPYQRLVLTQWKDDVWLYLNGNLQFSSYDEVRYHEPFVHPAMGLAPQRANILILGGGDGLAAREILKYPEVQKITLVDLDPAVTRLSSTHPKLAAVNQGSLQHQKVELVHTDAMHFINQTQERFDVIFIDLPDPKSVDLARLYALEFYKSIQKHLSRGGVVITQASSPFFSKDAFLCILKTMQETGMPTLPMQTHVPTMGQWGWVLAVNEPGVGVANLKAAIMNQTYDQIDTSYLNQDAAVGLLQFGKGSLENLPNIKANTFRSLRLVTYYQRGAWDFY